MQIVHVDETASLARFQPYLTQVLKASKIVPGVSGTAVVESRILEATDLLMVSPDVATTDEVRLLVADMVVQGRAGRVVLLNGNRKDPEAEQVVRANGGLVESKGQKPRPLAVAIRDHLKVVNERELKAAAQAREPSGC